MRLKLLVAMITLTFSASCLAQVAPSARVYERNISAGAGINFWWGDWGGAVKRLGPAAWVTADLYHGFGVQIEGHAMNFDGGGGAAELYTYYLGEGGFIYTWHHWNMVRPYAKAEAGFGSLTFPPITGLSYHHQNSHTWSTGGGVEIQNYKRLWSRIDYEYTFFPHFYSPISGEYHSLNPGGLTFGESYHF